MRASCARRGLLGCLTILTLFAVSAPARADTVTEWDQIAASALQSPPAAGGAGQGAPSMAHLAMVHSAVYDAVNAIDGGHEPYASSPPAEPWYSQDAAGATAARRVLVDGGLGVTTARLPAIEAAYAAALTAIPAGPAKQGGIATGEAAAAALLGARQGDGRFGPFRFTESTLTGAWRLVPPSLLIDPFAWLKNVEPFVLRSRTLFRARPPYDLQSRAYAQDFNEVKEIGSATSTTRTAEQTGVAQYWGVGNATVAASSIFRSIASGQGGTLADHARLLARIYTNAADALIVTWGDKERYSSWRPFTAIRGAASDGNAATEADPGWTALLGSPPYPEHPSGLSALVGAAAETAEHFYGTDRAAFSGTAPNGVTRQFTSFSQLVDDVVDARVWSGIHFAFADEEGAKIGRRVAHWGNRHAFR